MRCDNLLVRNRLQGDNRDGDFLTVMSATNKYPADGVTNQGASSTDGEMTVSHLAKKVYTIYGTGRTKFIDKRPIKCNQSIHSIINAQLYLLSCHLFLCISSNIFCLAFVSKLLHAYFISHIIT
jgi:hypothetical protein